MEKWHRVKGFAKGKLTSSNRDAMISPHTITIEETHTLLRYIISVERNISKQQGCSERQAVDDAINAPFRMRSALKRAAPSVTLCINASLHRLESYFLRRTLSNMVL